MKITKIHIERFRGFQNEDFELGSQLTAIAGQNGTQKSTLLGIVTQTFTINKNDRMRNEKPLCGGSYISAFKDKFRLSPTFDRPKGHEWTISFDEGVDDFTVESIKRTEVDNIRFWKKGARKEGDGYISFPTIFLSLKRLVPAAEESKIETNDRVLTQEEFDEFKYLHNKILIAQTPISSATTITSRNKQSLGVSTELYDWNQNSMGQDNLGKIILSLFSFKRLQQKYPKDYKGGILAIDELDATMYPASQVELLNVLRKYASKLHLQIIFTTHSLSLLKAVDNLIKEVNSRTETFNQVKLLYLKKIDDKISIKQNVDIEDIQLNLNVIAEGSKLKKKRVTVYTEDTETKLFAKAILKSKLNILNFVDVPFPCSMLIELVRKKVPAFMYPSSIVILDGDVKSLSNYKKIKDVNNVLVLPFNLSPERALASYLHNLSDTHELWTKVAKGYSKQVCFREYSIEQITSPGEEGRKNAKEWFRNQYSEYWGRSINKILTDLLKSAPKETEDFKKKFDNITTNWPL